VVENFSVIGSGDQLDDVARCESDTSSWGNGVAGIDASTVLRVADGGVHGRKLAAEWCWYC
jgi:hypothetical protein